MVSNNFSVCLSVCLSFCRGDANSVQVICYLNLLNISMMLNKSIIQCSLVGVIISALQNDHKYIFKLKLNAGHLMPLKKYK